MIKSPKIVLLEEACFIGLQASFLKASSKGANNMLVIPELWNQFYRVASKIPFKNDPEGAFYGLSQEPAKRGLEPSDPCECLYLACARVDPKAQAPEGMAVWEIAGGMHAKFEYQGKVSELGNAIRYIYEEWLPASIYAKASGPLIERYDHRFDPFSPKSILEILIPLYVR